MPAWPRPPSGGSRATRAPRNGAHRSRPPRSGPGRLPRGSRVALARVTTTSVSIWWRARCRQAGKARRGRRVNAVRQGRVAQALAGGAIGDPELGADRAPGLAGPDLPGAIPKAVDEG